MVLAHCLILSGGSLNNVKILTEREKENVTVMSYNVAIKSFLMAELSFPPNPFLLPTTQAISICVLSPAPRGKAMLPIQAGVSLIKNGGARSLAELPGSAPVFPHGRRTHCRSTPQSWTSSRKSDRPAMWVAKGTEVMTMARELEETCQGCVEAKQMAWPLHRGLRNHSSKLTAQAYVWPGGPGEGCVR